MGRDPHLGAGNSYLFMRVFRMKGWALQDSRVEGGRGGISRWGVAVASDFRHVLVPQSIP